MQVTNLNAGMASHITRLLILSYFVALAIGWIEGAEFNRLATPFLPEPHATYFMGTMVLILCFMVLIGMFRRPAALLLAMTLFWAGYVTMFATGDLTGFWRDLALIGGLLMSAGVGTGWSVDKTSAPIEAEETVIHDTAAPPEGDAPKRRASITRFREDLDIAREA